MIAELVGERPPLLLKYVRDTTFAPSATKPRAWLAPIPWAPPVTITVRLSKRFIIGSFHKGDLHLCEPPSTNNSVPVM